MLLDHGANVNATNKVDLIAGLDTISEYNCTGIGWVNVLIAALVLVGAMC